MNKLERKLIELGYETDCEIYQIWHKGNIQIITFYGRIENYCVIVLNNIYRQQDIDSIQEEFNILQQDLEVLREYE